MNEFILYKTLQNIFFISMFVISLLSYQTIRNDSLYQESDGLKIWTVIAVLIAFVTIAFFPTLIGHGGGDKALYARSFIRINSIESNFVWSGLTYLIRLFTSNVTIYFSIIAALYIGLRWLACKNLVASNPEILLLAFLFSFQFFGYGTNTIRAGLASSLTILAISIFPDKKWLGAVIASSAIFTHLSMVIPLAAYTIAYYKPNVKLFLGLWVISIGLSVVAGNGIALHLAQFIHDTAGNQAADYILHAGNGHYKSGLRIDFILYSSVPIIVGLLYIFKYDYREKFYLTIYSTYLLANTFFVLVIRANFIDRFGYLSWMLIPVVLLYPLMNSDNFPNKEKYISLTLVLLELFTFVMFLRG